MSYFIRAQKKRTFDIEYDNRFISVLRFPSWTSSNAIAELSDGTYQFTKNSFWKSQYDILKEGMPFGKISFNWKGHILLNLIDDSGLVPSSMEMDTKTTDEDYLSYTVKSKGVFKKRYELFQPKNPRPLITLQPKSNWLKVNYQVTLHHSDIIPFTEESIITIMAFGVILLRKRQAAAGAAAG